MLSDLSCGTFDIPTLPGPSALHPEEDPLAPLNFDDLLDIAREFEFTRTITHIWPCEERSPCHETGLDDILAAIVPTPNAAESPIPLPNSTPSTTTDSVRIQEVDLNESAFVCAAPDANVSILKYPMSLPKDTDQVRAGTRAPITSTLRGWCPPNGSQFLDLDDSLMLPQPTTEVWNSPWLAMFLATSSTQPVGDVNQSSTTVSAIGDSQPQTLATVSEPPSVSTTDKTANEPTKKSVPTPVQPSTRTILEPIRAQTNSNVASQSAITPHAKTPKSRPHLPSTPATGGASSANYARAPRGGIPPHIARSVTKASILRVEKERKVMQDTFSSTTTGEGKKPSVLRKAAKVERATSKRVDGGGSGKKLFEWDENDEREGRAVKRARV